MSVCDFQPANPVVCTWSSFLDTESPIVEFKIFMGSQQGGDDIFANGTTPGHIATYSISGE